MEESQLVLNIAIALTVAFLGGVLARRAGLPVIAGYILGGILISPATPGFDADVETVRVLAELGVAFLMFSIGVDFSLHELNEVRRIALIGGSLQVGLTTVFGALIALLLGWEWAAALLFGMIVALSSSVVAIKLLLARGETATRHGRVTAGIAVVQDLSLVPMLVVLPMLGSEGGNVVGDLIRSLIVAVVVLGAVVILGLRLIPKLFELVAATASRELFLLAIVVVSLGTAIATEEAGLSLALGAFLAGLIVSESDFSHQILADIVPLREVFATLFFVSVGMLLDPRYLGDNLGVVALVVAIVIVGKLVILSGIGRALGLAAGTSLFVGILLAQIGEFSFVLANEGRDQEILRASEYDLVLSISAGTLVLSPFLVNATPRAFRAVGGALGRRDVAGLLELDEHGIGARHTIVCGYGRLGSELVDALQRRGFACVVIDSDATAVRLARADGVDAVFGDAGSPEVLQRLGIGRARVLAVAISDPLATEAAVRYATNAYPRLDVIARARSREQLRKLRELGATEVVQPEFEAGLELIRHVLHVHGLDQRQVSAIVQGRRTAYYAEPDEEP